MTVKQIIIECPDYEFSRQNTSFAMVFRSFFLKPQKQIL